MQCPALDYQQDPTATQESPTQGVLHALPSETAEVKDTTLYTTRSGRQISQVTKPVRLDFILSCRGAGHTLFHYQKLINFV